MGREYIRQAEILGQFPWAERLIYYDDCEGTFMWSPGGTGGDDVHDFTTTNVLEGTESCEMKTRATGAAAADYLTLTRRLSPKGGDQVEMALAFYLMDDTAMEYIDFTLKSWGSYGAIDRTLRFDLNVGADGHDLKVQTAAAEYTDTGVDFVLTADYWHWLRWQMDLSENLYGSLWVAGQEVDLTAQAAYEVNTTAVTPRLDVQFRIEHTGEADFAAMDWDVFMLREV